MAASLVVQKCFFENNYDVSGHASGHLNSASAPFGAFVLLAVLFLATPGARRKPLVVLSGALWLGGTVAILVGNVRVVDALIRAGMAHTPTSRLVSSPEIEAAHGLANAAPWFCVAAALGLTAALWRAQFISGRLTTASALITAVFPAWIIPGAGLFVLTIARCLQYHGQPSRPEPDDGFTDHNVAVRFL